VVVTEAATAAGILVLLALPLWGCLVVLPLVGIALNGTSSVLYGTVADLVTSDRRAPGYGIFFTPGVAAAAPAPVVHGMLGDSAGIRATLAVIGIVVVLVVPLTRVLRAPLEAVTAMPRA